MIADALNASWSMHRWRETSADDRSRKNDNTMAELLVELESWNQQAFLVVNASEHPAASVVAAANGIAQYGPKRGINWRTNAHFLLICKDPTRLTQSDSGRVAG
jgi:hypothetical protein